MSEINLYICLHDGFWLFYEPIVQEFLASVDALLPNCPGCKKEMHCVSGLERLQLLSVEKPKNAPEMK